MNDDRFLRIQSVKRSERADSGYLYSADSFHSLNLFGDKPHPSTLNLQFVGATIRVRRRREMASYFLSLYRSTGLDFARSSLTYRAGIVGLCQRPAVCTSVNVAPA